MSPQPPPGRAVQLYEALVATHPDIERKGKSSPYTSVNGNMFTVLSADGTLGMLLAAADRDAFHGHLRHRPLPGPRDHHERVRSSPRRPAGTHL